MCKESFIFYKSFYDAIHKLKDKELKADIFESICELALNENDITLNNDVGSIIMELIKPQILANNKRYENGKKGGAPKGNQNARKEPMVENKNNQKTTKKQPNVNVNDNVNVNVNDKYIYYSDGELNKIFLEYLDMRKKLKAVNSDRAIKMLLKKLEPYSDDIKYKMIEQSIIKSWKDIYEIKEQKNNVPEWFNKEIKDEEMSEDAKRVYKEITGNDYK